MHKTEIIIGDLKIKHIDSLNWQIFERRAIKKSNNPKFKSRSGEIDWVGMPVYYSTLKPAVIKARDICLGRGIDTTTIDEAVKQLEKLDADFTVKLHKALKEADDD